MRFVSQLKDRTKDLIIIILALILCTVIFFLRYRYNCALLVSHPRLLAACDTLFAVGFIYILWGIIMYATFKGALDAFFYVIRNLINNFKKDKNLVITPYYDYVMSRKRTPNRFKTFLISGGILMVLSVILMILYLKVR
ncbi:MAG: DUF3899 domain-containing protein [Oscillospiraceae bacterium]|nr:DUF3899 domain-containing protein [Oscillospiraceae bacterium]